MWVFLIVLLGGTTVNTLNDHPHNAADVKASIVKQVTHPVKAPGGPYNK